MADDRAQAAAGRPGRGRFDGHDALVALNADKVIEEKADDLKPYGLDRPDARRHRSSARTARPTRC